MACTLAVRATMLFPLNFSCDTYLFVSYFDAYFAHEFRNDFAQMRFGGVALYWIMQQIGAGYPFAGALLPILGCAAIAGFALAARRLWMPASGFAHGLIFVLLLSLHPYASDLLTYHAGLPLYIFALGAGALGLLITSDRPGRFLAATGLFSLVPSFYQPIYTWLLVVVLVEMMFAVQGPLAGHRTLPQLVLALAGTPAARRLAALFCGAILYLPIGAVLAHYFGPGHPVRTELAGLRDIIPHAVVAAKMTYWWAFKGEVVLPFAVKIVQWALLVAAVLPILRAAMKPGASPSRWTGSIVFALLLAGAWIACLAVLLPLKGMQPNLNLRTTAALVCFWGGMFALAASGPGRMFTRTVTAIGLTLVICFGLNSNRLSADHARLNERDRLLASRIIERLSSLPDFGNVRRVAVIGGTGLNLDRISSSTAGFNISALDRPWSQSAVLREISGYPFQFPTEADMSEALAQSKSAPRWPAVGSILIRGDLAIVCLPDSPE
jgi:hypothetical protein